MKYQKKPFIIEAYQTFEEKIIHTLEGDMKASVGDYIITGTKGEQYPCKPDIFKEIYTPLKDKTTGMSIGEAITALEVGERCARKAWNDKNQYIELVHNASYIDGNGNLINAKHDTYGNKVIAFVGTFSISSRFVV